MNAVHAVAGRLAATRSEAELRAAYLRHVGSLVGAEVHSIYLHGPDGRPVSVDAAGIPERVLQRYEEIGRAEDPVLGLMVAEHVPVSALDLLGEQGWHSSALYDHVMGPAGLEHYIVAPLLGGGRIVGTLGFCRHASAAPFGAADVRHAGALAHHVSALVAGLQGRPAAVPLTDRDREIVALVARGLTNAEIGHRLHISPNTVKQTLKRIFARLGVRSRAELVARAYPMT
ncbi:helix-turn-helix transcriptional regulator [Pseudonocardia xishanensis]|uniref:HTH luxR-type domain-containing protein n=1 Tax=Pseudonocardia xishanensis TaxID=630995 RepID=A0ABP8RSY8_9PSEU